MIYLWGCSDVSMKQIATLLQGVIAFWAGLFINFLGGRDNTLNLLFILILFDILSGLAVAMFFGKSKHGPGGLNSQVMFAGLAKKVFLLALVGISHQLDVTMGTNTIRSTCVLFFCGDEGLSILENLGIMGVPYPDFIKRMLDVMKEEDNGSDK